MKARKTMSKIDTSDKNVHRAESIAAIGGTYDKSREKKQNARQLVR